VKDVTDATFETDVLLRSEEVPVVVDLWAPWCMPCRTLGPILEQAVASTEGRVELAKVNVDDNQRIAMSFRVQSIPAVFAIRNRDIVDSFVGALGPAAVTEFVKRLDSAPGPVELLIGEGDEDSLREALALDPGNPAATAALAELLTARGEAAEALALLAKVPETAEVRRAAAAARLAQAGAGNGAAGGAGGEDDLEARIEALLAKVKTDDEARQELVDVLETMDPEDPRRGRYRRALASRLF
jgi:putative thioredoxin